MSLTRECATSSADILRKQVGGTLDVLKVATLVHGVYVRTPVVRGALPAPYVYGYGAEQQMHWPAANKLERLCLSHRGANSMPPQPIGHTQHTPVKLGRGAERRGAIL